MTDAGLANVEDDPPGAEEIEIDTRVQRTSTGRDWLAVEAPAGLGSHPDPPVHRGIEHALLRPYETVTQTGNPVVGAVQYHLIHLPGDPWPRVLFGTAVRDNASEDADLLPGDVFVFQGVDAEQHFQRRGEHLAVHHLSIRETDSNEIWAYTHADPVGEDAREGPIREEARASVDNDPFAVHVAQFWLRDRSVIDDAGLAMAPLSEDGQASMQARGQLTPDPLIRNHPLDRLPIDSELHEYPNHLWMGLFLTQEPPTARQQEAILRFYQSQDFLDGFDHVEAVPEYEGDVTVRGRVMDLAAIGAPARYRYLLSLKAVLQGRLDQDTAFGCKAMPLPLNEIFRAVGDE